MAIVASGYYGFGNLGDEAVLDGIAAAIAEIGDARLTALSIDPQRTMAEHPGLKAVPRYSPIQLLRAIRGAQAVISGGGSLLQDTTSLRSLQYYLFVLRLAHLLRRKTMVYAQGIGPLNSEKSRRGVARTLNRVDAITVRDSDSKALLESIGVNQVPIQVVADPSFLVSPDIEAADSILSRHPAEAGRPMLAVSLRTWRNQDAWLPKVAEGIARACDELGLTPVALPMQPSEDAEACRAVKGAIVIDEPMSPRSAKGIISRCSLLVGMRLHSLMFAAGTGVPFVALSYDPKVRSFASSVQPSGALDINEIEPDAFAQAITSAWRERDSLRTAMLAKADPLQHNARISGEALRGLLAGSSKEH